MPIVNQNLLVHQDGYHFFTQIPGDAVLGISYHGWKDFYIQEDAPNAFNYCGQFSVTNRLPISLDDVLIFLASGENPDQANLQSQFLQGNGSWGPDLQVDIGHLEPRASSVQQHFTMRIIRTVPGGALNAFGLKIYFNPSYRVSYSSCQDIWVAEAQVNVVT